MENENATNDCVGQNKINRISIETQNDNYISLKALLIFASTDCGTLTAPIYCISLQQARILFQVSHYSAASRQKIALLLFALEIIFSIVTVLIAAICRTALKIQFCRQDYILQGYTASFSI